MKAMTQMENAVINMTSCNRKTANLVVNAILDIDRETSITERCALCGKEINQSELKEHKDGRHYCKDCSENILQDCKDCYYNILQEEFYQEHGRYAGELK